MKKTPDDILKTIEDTFMPQDTLAQMKNKFYERVQMENETLESYSRALMKMLHNICRKEGGDNRGFGDGSVTYTKIICYRCKAEGHKRNECPELTKTSKAEHQSKSNPNAGPSQR